MRVKSPDYPELSKSPNTVTYLSLKSEQMIYEKLKKTVNYFFEENGIAA
jgi:hypothetical protein